MEKLGTKLLTARLRLKLSRPDVSSEADRIAELYGNMACKISESWLYRIETNRGRANGITLLTLLHIYRLGVEELLGTDDTLDDSADSGWHLPLTPDSHMILDPGPVDDLAKSLLPEEYLAPPEMTMVLPNDPQYANKRYVRAIIGSNANRAYPMLRPGAIVLIDQQQRDINKRVTVKHEFDTPLFFFRTHGAPICGWAHRHSNGTVSIWAHPAAQMDPINLQSGQEAELIGRIVAVKMWLAPQTL